MSEIADSSSVSADQAQVYFLGLADVLRELGYHDLLGRLAEIYLDFREVELSR